MRSFQITIQSKKFTDLDENQIAEPDHGLMLDRFFVIPGPHAHRAPQHIPRRRRERSRRRRAERHQRGPRHSRGAPKLSH